MTHAAPQEGNTAGRKSQNKRLFVKLDNGTLAVERGGRISAYINPKESATLKDMLVDRRLVDDFGVWDIDKLTEDQLVDNRKGQDSRWVHI